MKLVVLALCLCLANADSKENARRGNKNVSRANSKAEDDAGNDALDSGTDEPASIKPKRILLSRKYAIFPGGKVSIPEDIQQYRRCFGDINLQNILEWFLKTCAKGMCDGLESSGFNLGMGNGESNGESNGDSNLLSSVLGGNVLDMFGIGMRSNRENMDNALKEDENAEPEVQRKNKRKNNSKVKRRNKDEAAERATEKKAGKDKGESRKEISDKKANAKQKIIPYSRERRELENVTLQFKALPNGQKDKFCEYLENDLLEDPMHVLQAMLGILQFGDKKESGVHYDRNRGMTLASIASRTDREAQILKWACQDRREGQRKLYMSTKRFFAAQRADRRRRRGGQRNSELESGENTFGDLGLHSEMDLHGKLYEYLYAQTDYSMLAKRFSRLYRSADNGANSRSRSYARSDGDDVDAAEDEEDYINTLENAKNERRAYRNIPQDFMPRSSKYRYLANF